MKRMLKAVLWGVGILAVLLTAGFFISGSVIHRKFDAAIAALPPAVRVSYASFHCSLLDGTMDLDSVKVSYTGDQRVYEATLDHVGLEGIHYLEVMRKKQLRLGRLRLEGIR